MLATGSAAAWLLNRRAPRDATQATAEDARGIPGELPGAAPIVQPIRDRNPDLNRSLPPDTPAQRPPSTREADEPGRSGVS